MKYSILEDPGTVSGGGKKSKRARKKLTLLRPNFFLARLDFFPPPLTAPGSPRKEIFTKGDLKFPKPYHIAKSEKYETFCASNF